MFLFASSCRATEEPAGPLAAGNADGLGVENPVWRKPKGSCEECGETLASCVFRTCGSSPVAGAECQEEWVRKRRRQAPFSPAS